MYRNNYVSSAQPFRPSSSLEDYKSPAEDEIIDSYITTSVALPKQSYPAHQRGPPPTYPPLAQSPSYQGSWTSNSRMTDPGGEIDLSGSQYTATKEVVKNEKRSLLDILLPDSMACRLYVLTVLIETFIDIAIEADLLLRLKRLSGELDSAKLPVYLSIFTFAHVFQLAMAIDAVHARNTLQFMFLTIFNTLLLLYAAVQIVEIRSSLPASSISGGISDIPVHVLTTIIPIVISIAEVAYIALGWKIYREFGWKVYKQLGADRRVKRMYAHYQILVCVMKFDVFFFIGFTVQLIVLVLTPGNWQWYITCAAVPFSFLILVLGMLAARYENIVMMVCFMLGCTGAEVYFVYKLVRIFQMRQSIQDTIRTLTIFAVVAIILLVVTVVMALIVMRNFGGGLKYHMTKPAENEHKRNQSKRNFPNPSRMSID